MKLMPGPDFPTGAYICGRKGIHEAYTTGRGHVILRAAATIETAKGLKASIVVNQIPYTVNKARLIEEIAGLVHKKKIEGISDIRDESDRDGMRIVIELKRGENAEVILNQLYKHTRMQNTFGIILLAIVDGKPIYLTLPEILHCFIDHRRDVIVRRTRFLLDKAEKRAHILEGLRVAIQNIDEVIQIIRQAKDPQVAKSRLIKRFNFSDVQAQAILEMRLQRLTNMERDKLEAEYKQLMEDIKYLRDILDHPGRVMEVMREELLEIKTKFSDPRRTVIVDAVSDLEVEDLIAEENMVITISHAGYIKRIATSTYRQQKRGGRGVTAMSTKETDFVEHLFIASTHHYILFFSNFGKAYWLKVYEIPQGGRAAKGKAIVNLLNLEHNEHIEAFVPVSEFDEKHFLIMTTAKGIIKKTNLSAFSNPRRAGIIAINLDKDDALLSVAMSDGTNEVVIATQQGKAIRFHEKDVRAMGRTSRGVRAINLKKEDRVIGMVLAKEDATLLTVTEKGFGKRTAVSEYRKIKRGGQGVINIQQSERNGQCIGILTVYDEDELMIITEKGIAIRQSVKYIRSISRNTQGVRLIRLDDQDRVVAVAKVEEKDEDEELESGTEE
jgi:DNA gyrase subunit A